MKNIFSHNKRTSTPAHQRTNISVILKHKVVTSILKNLSIKKVKKQSTVVLRSLSLRAKRGNLYTSIHSLYLAQSSRLKAHGVFFPKLSTINYKLLTLFAHGMLVLLFISVMLIQSGCSLFGYYKIERFLGTNSICWEDNEHILIYASIAEYSITQDPIGGEEKHYNWTGGEIWRITASTGVKELLFREKGAKYWAWDNTTGMRIDAINGNIYICDELFTYKVRDDFSEWDSLGYFTLPNVSSDEKYLVGIDEDGDVKVKKYSLGNNTSEELYVNDELITWLDYDYERNYLLINSYKFVDLNTGEEVIVCESGDSIGDYFIARDNMGSGKIIEEYLTMDVTVRNINDTEINEYRFKLRININDINEKELLIGVNGILSPDNKKYAVPGLFTDTLGDTLSTWTLPSTEL